VTVSVNSALSKLQHTTAEPFESALVAFSGGLDSTLCLAMLQRLYSARTIVPVLFNVGQSDRELENAVNAARRFTSVETRVIDLRPEFYDQWLVRALMANGSFRGYPIAAPIAKQLMAAHLAATARETGIDVIVEGSSGRGNDQFRLSGPVALLAPSVRVVSPIRDFDLTRKEEEELCRLWDVPYPMDVPPGGDDLTLWCRSIASGMFDLDSQLQDGIWRWWRNPAHQPPLSPLEVRIGFDRGRPVTVDGVPVRFVEILMLLNAEAGVRGVGRIDIMEDGILNLKSREVYEAPAATVLLAAHRSLEELCLTARELRFKAAVEAEWVQLVYGANAFDPLLDALDAFVARTQLNVTGEITVLLHHGGFYISGRSSPRSLYSRRLRHLSGTGIVQPRLEGAVYAHRLQYLALAERDDDDGK